MENTVNVIKRDGSVAPLKVSEIRKKISEIVELTVPEHLREETTQNIEINLRQYIKNNIHTSEIQTWLIKSIVEMIDIDKPYLEYSAAKAVLQKIYHDVYKNTNISVYPEDLQSAFKKYIKTYSSKALLSPKFKELTESQLNLLSDMIDYSRDNLFKYIGIHTLQSRYLLRDKGLIVELPQWRFMTIAMYLAFHDSDTIDVDQAQKYYDLLSTFKFMCATPTLNNGGKIRHQLSSCFVLQVPDNIEGIFDISKEVAIYSKWGGGAGGDITSVRGRNGPIRGMPGKSKGVISWSKIYNDTVVAVDQLGCVAKGSIVQRLSKIASVDGHLVGVKAFDPTYRMYYVEQLNKEILKFEDYTDFLSKSPVKWQAETVTIDRIIEGDYVLSYDINTKSWCYKKVLQVHDDITVETKDQIQITTEYDSVITSKWHPMLIERNNELVYVKSEELKIGDQVVTLFPGKDPRSKVVDINLDPKANTHYYDLSVEDTNNYACSSLTDPANTVKYPQVAMSVIHNTRPGALALYLQLWHTDLLDFLSMRRNSGDDRQRARDIFPGITVPDLFMQRLEQGGNWSFFDPYQHPELVDSHSDEFKKLYEAAELKGDAISTIPCIEVWREVIKMQLETGMPFIMFKDTVNRANRHPEAGFIYSSQLCLSGDTMVAVADGRNAVSIKQLAEESKGINKFDVYCGVTNDTRISGVPSRTYERQAYGYAISKAVAFSNGFKKVVKLTLSNGDTFKCTPDHELFLRDGGKIRADQSLGKELNSFFTYANVGPGNKYRMINTERDNYALGEYDAELTMKTRPDFNADRLEYIRTHLRQYRVENDREICRVSGLTVTKIEEAGEEEVFDLTVDHEEHSFYILTSGDEKYMNSQGILVSNCSEITLPTKPNIYGIEVTYKDGTKEVFPHDTYIQKFGCISNNITESHPGIVQVDTVIYELGETAVCNLGSINLVEYYHMVPEKRKEMVFNCVKFLDSVIDLNMYVTPQSRKGAHKTRAIGLGVMNEHALLAELKIHYGSEQHEKLIHDLYASIEEYSDKASEMISGTPGVRKNLYIRAIAPTGSISLITGCTSSHDPIYKRKWFEENALGSIPVLVPNLSPDTWEYYTPAFDIDPEDAVKINAARQKYIDQAISFAIYIDPNKEYTNPETGEKITPAAKLSRALKLAWKLGIKTTYYIRSKSSDINEELNTMKVACEGCQ